MGEGGALWSEEEALRLNLGYHVTRKIVHYQSLFNGPAWKHKYVQVRSWGEEKMEEKKEIWMKKGFL